MPGASLEADGCAGRLLAAALGAPTDLGAQSAAQALATILNKAKDVGANTPDQLMAQLGEKGGK